MRVFNGVAELSAAAGESLGTSDWTAKLVVDQIAAQHPLVRSER